MNPKNFQSYLNLRVAVGVPSKDDTNRLFYYFGELTRIDDDSISLDVNGKEIMLATDRIKYFASNQYYCK
jgi:hypothetical protein